MGMQRSTLFVAGGKVLSAAVTFVGITLFTRRLGSSGIGLFFLFQSLLSFISLVSSLSLQTAAEKRISEGQPKGEVISSAAVLRAIALAVAITLIWRFRDNITDYLGSDATMLLILGLILTNISEFVVRVMSGELQIGRTAILRLSQQVVWLISGLVLVWFGYGVIGPIVGLLLGLFVVSVWGVVRSDIEFSRPTIQRSKNLLAFSKYDLVAGASRKVYNWADVLIIGYFLTPAAVGNYEIAWRVTVIAGLLSTSVSQVVFPQISYWKGKDLLNKIEDGLSEAIALSLALVIPALFGALILGGPILSVIFDIDSSEATIVLVILMVSRLIFVNFQPMKRILDGLDKVNLSARATLVSAVANIILNVILVQNFGIVGVAVGTTIAVFIGAILVVYYLRLYLEITYPMKTLVGFFGSSIVMAGVLLGLTSHIQVDTIPELLGIVLVGGVVYFAVLSMYSPTRGFLKSQYESFFVT